MNGYIYLYHFTKKVCPDRHTCQHYLGYCKDLWERARMHLGGKGARLTQVAIERDIEIKIVRVWKGSRKDERRLKNWKNSPKLCPVCSRQPHNVTSLHELSKEEINELIGPLYA